MVTGIDTVALGQWLESFDESEIRIRGSKIDLLCCIIFGPGRFNLECQPRVRSDTLEGAIKGTVVTETLHVEVTLHQMRRLLAGEIDIQSLDWIFDSEEIGS